MGSWRRELREGEDMIRGAMVRLTMLMGTLLSIMDDRRQRFVEEPERGDENIKNVFYAVLAVTLAVAVTAAITAAVNGRIPLIK